MSALCPLVGILDSFTEKSGSFFGVEEKGGLEEILMNCVDIVGVRLVVTVAPLLYTHAYHS